MTQGPDARALFDALATTLEPHGFVAISREYLHRKTWNTNRGVVVTPLGHDIAATIYEAAHAARLPMKHSWWNQLGLQIVLETNGDTPPAAALKLFVDGFNHQGVLIQSVFAVNVASGAWTEARTWGQVITGKYQDAIAETLASTR